jgi:hypothetical protein
MAALLSEREAEAKAQEKHDKLLEAMYTGENLNSGSDSYSDIGSVTELASSKSPPSGPAVPASQPGNQLRRLTQSNIGIPARGFGGVAIMNDPRTRFAQIRMAGLSASSTDTGTLSVGARNRTIPKSYPEMRPQPDSKQKLWETAKVTEYASLLQNDTFELVNLPPG